MFGKSTPWITLASLVFFVLLMLYLVDVSLPIRLSILARLFGPAAFCVLVTEVVVFLQERKILKIR